MRLFVTCFVILIAAGCADRFVTQGETVGRHVWFAEVRDPASGEDETRLIVCNVSSAPPCVRLMPRDLRTIEQFKAWLRTERAEAAARAAPVPGAAPAEVMPPPEATAPATPAQTTASP